jgi:hypothetical protein
MAADNDAEMLEKLGNAVTDLEVRFRNCSLEERVDLRSSLETLVADFTEFRLRLLKEGIITTDEELKEMDDIKNEINAAAQKQSLLKAIARTIGFVATKI